MKVGILGLGSIGARHAKNLMVMGHEVVAYDPQSAPLPGREEVIVESEAILICTPTIFHAEDFVDIFNGTNIPTFMEKPLSNRAWRLVTTPTMMGNNLRFHPCVKQAKEWILEGKLGTPLWANFTCAQQNEKYEDGVIGNWGGHEIDLALYLLGPAEVEACVAKLKGREVIADIILNQNDCQTTIHLDYLSEQWLRTGTLCGTNGMIALDLDGRNAGWAKADGTDSESHSFKGSYDDDYKLELYAFFNMIAGLKTNAATGQDGLETLKIILEARRIAGVDQQGDC